MQIFGEAIVLHAKPQSAGAFVLSLFSKEFGKISGLIRLSSKDISKIQQGNIVEFEHLRRLETQLGVLQVETAFAPSARVFHSAERMLALSYVGELLHHGMREGDAHADLYEQVEAFLKNIHKEGLWERLGILEAQFLQASGYGLSLEEWQAVRAGEGDVSPLSYVSPKTGRAVSETMGAPYIGKILPLPALFGGNSHDFLDVFNLTGHFLDIALEGKVLQTRAHLIASAKETGFKELL